MSPFSSLFGGFRCVSLFLLILVCVCVCVCQVHCCCNVVSLFFGGYPAEDPTREGIWQTEKTMQKSILFSTIGLGVWVF